jgi:Periplasmic copper-binding protein (NosD)
VVANGSGGIQITQSRAELDGTLVRHTDNGLTSLDASSVRIDGGVILDGNGTGVVVDGGSSLESFGATISNSGLAGIEVSEHSYVSLSGTTISGNRNGIELVRHSSFHLGARNMITANTGYGIFLFDLSFANFDPGNNVTGNNRSGIGALDVACFTQYTATRGALTNIGGGTTNCAEN